TIIRNYHTDIFYNMKSALVKSVSEQVLRHLETLKAEDNGEVKVQTTLQSEKALYTEAKSLLGLIDSLDTQNYRHFYIHMDDEIDKLNLLEEITLSFDKDNNNIIQESRHNEFTVNNDSDINLEPFKALSHLLEQSQRYSEYHKLIKDKLSRIENNKANISVFGGF